MKKAFMRRTGSPCAKGACCSKTKRPEIALWRAMILYVTWKGQNKVSSMPKQTCNRDDSTKFNVLAGSAINCGLTLCIDLRDRQQRQSIDLT